MVIVAIFSIVFALVVGVMQTLDIYSTIVPARALSFAIVFFVLPVLVVVLVSADNVWGRFVVCLFLVGAASFYALVEKSIAMFPDRDKTVASIVLVTAMLLSAWFYQSPKLRQYVRHVRSYRESVSLKRGDSGLPASNPAATRRRAIYIDVLEVATIVVLLALVAGAIAQWNTQA
ncbi:MAG: hypothetical protein AAGL69_06360 [Pseudomonadota bacterium]